jgi:hypothetical protein
MTGEETRSCWQGEPEMIASLPRILGPMVPAVEETDLAHVGRSDAGPSRQMGQETLHAASSDAPTASPSDTPEPGVRPLPLPGSSLGPAGSQPESAPSLRPAAVDELDAGARARLGRLVEAPRVSPARRIATTAELSGRMDPEMPQGRAMSGEGD